MFSRKIRVYQRDPERDSDHSRVSAHRKTSTASTRERSEKDRDRDRDRDRERDRDYDPSDRKVSKHRSLESRPSEHHRPSGFRTLSHSQSNNLPGYPDSSRSPTSTPRMSAAGPDISRPTSVTVAESVPHSGLHKQYSQDTVQPLPHHQHHHQPNNQQHDSLFTPDTTDVCNTPSPSREKHIRHAKSPNPPSPPLTDTGGAGAERSNRSGPQPALNSSDPRSRAHTPKSSSKLRKSDADEKARSSKSSKSDREHRHRSDSSRSKTSRTPKDPSRHHRDRSPYDGLDTPSSGTATPREPRPSHNAVHPVYTDNLAIPTDRHVERHIDRHNANTTPVTPLTPRTNEPIPPPMFRRPVIMAQRSVHAERHPTPHAAPTEICETPGPRPLSAVTINDCTNSGMYDLSEGSAPPPPPPIMPPDPPRVDYLLQNGGLHTQVTRNLLDLAPTPASAIPNGLSANSILDMRAQAVFAPFTRLLHDYAEVMKRNGSIAVASGYRSVARRLLERLEAVFARNISSEYCACVMCQSQSPDGRVPETATGMSWGEVLEYVAGRRELPQWPAFTLATSALDLESTVGAPEAPMQKLDVDVPEAYRHHYVRQSQKTKHAVQNWLATQPEEPSSPPEELDDDTITFAIVTHLDPHMRQMYVSLLPGHKPAAAAAESEGASSADDASDVTSMADARKQVLVKAQLAIQRLYRLEHAPRESECALYLVKNPGIHGVIATIAAVSEHEWDILVSGRFDGFLWSGAEEYPIHRPGLISRPSTAQANPNGSPHSNLRAGGAGTPLSATPVSAYGSSQGPISRAATASAPPPGTVPSFAGAPVSLDEENEIAALVDVERNIYACMEALENAFETLHNHAERVRGQLVERSGGLLMRSRARRGGAGGAATGLLGNLDVRGLTPISGLYGLGAADGMVGMGGDAGGMLTHPQSVVNLDPAELGPDDSVSNVSSYRRRRRKEKQARSGRRMGARPEVVPEEED